MDSVLAERRVVDIYELLDPRTAEVRYVGQSVDSKRRVKWHLRAAARGRRGYIYNWIRQLLSLGLEPVWRVLQQVDEESADDREIYWIQARRAAGCRLTNATDGGLGGRGRRLSEETRRKIGAAHAGKTVSVEARAKVSRAKAGKPLKPEHRELVVAALRRRRWDDRQRKSISDRMKGNQLGRGRSPSTETRLAASRARSGERSPTASASNAQASEVRRLHAEGMSQGDIMRLTGLSRVTVHRIVRRKTYKHSA